MLLPVPLVFDNLILKDEQDRLENLILLSRTFPWYYIPDVTTKTDKELNPGFFHTAFTNNTGANSFIYDDLLKVLNNIALELNLNIKELIRIRIGLNLPNNAGCDKVNTPHIDLDFPHITALYYLNTASGSTVLYDREYSVNGENKDVMLTVKPKKGRVLLFDGQQYHSSSSSPNETRVVVTFNFII
jgi:hypothetical protein